MLAGVIAGWMIMRLVMKFRAQNIIKEAEAEAEVIKRDKILQAKEKFLPLTTPSTRLAASTRSRWRHATARCRRRRTS